MLEEWPLCRVRFDDAGDEDEVDGGTEEDEDDRHDSSDAAVPQVVDIMTRVRRCL